MVGHQMDWIKEKKWFVGYLRQIKIVVSPCSSGWAWRATDSLYGHGFSSATAAQEDAVAKVEEALDTIKSKMKWRPQTTPLYATAEEVMITIRLRHEWEWVCHSHSFGEKVSGPYGETDTEEAAVKESLAAAKEKYGEEIAGRLKWRPRDVEITGDCHPHQVLVFLDTQDGTWVWRNGIRGEGGLPSEEAAKEAAIASLLCDGTRLRQEAAAANYQDWVRGGRRDSHW